MALSLVCQIHVNHNDVILMYGDKAFRFSFHSNFWRLNSMVVVKIGFDLDGEG